MASFAKGWANIDAGLLSYLGHCAEHRGPCLDDLTHFKGLDPISNDIPAKFNQFVFMRNRCKTSIPMSPSVSEYSPLPLLYLV